MLKLFQKKPKITIRFEEPDIRLLNKGIIECSKCSNILKLDQCYPLIFEACPKCSTANFIPYLVENYWLYYPIVCNSSNLQYKALDTERGEYFSVRILPRSLKANKEAITALMNEAKLGVKFKAHPNVISVLDYGKADEDYFIATEHVAGGTIDRIVQDKLVIPEKNLLFSILQILSSLQYIYDCGYLYRSITPRDILLDNGGNAKLLNFEHCQKIEDARGITIDNSRGAVEYCSPERFDGRSETMSSEIYSLGMLMYFCLTGKGYYNTIVNTDVFRHNYFSTRKKKRNIYSRLTKCANPDTVIVVDKMIRNNPRDRYQSYEDVYSDICKIYEMYSFR